MRVGRVEEEEMGAEGRRRRMRMMRRGGGGGSGGDEEAEACEQSGVTSCAKSVYLRLQNRKYGGRL